MELETKEEGASLFVEEYGLLLSRFHKIFEAVQAGIGLSTQDVLLSLQKEVLKEYPDIPILRLTVLSEAIIERYDIL
jgi:hypothetical protein